MGFFSHNFKFLKNSLKIMISDLRKYNGTSLYFQKSKNHDFIWYLKKKFNGENITPKFCIFASFDILWRHILSVPSLPPPQNGWMCSGSFTAPQPSPALCTEVHCIALHCTSLHCTALCSFVLNWSTLHWTALHCNSHHYTAHCTSLLCAVLHFPPLTSAALHCTAMHHNALRNALHFITLQCTTLHFTALPNALHFITLQCTTLHFTPMPCPVMHCTARHCTKLFCNAHAQHFTKLH